MIPAIKASFRFLKGLFAQNFVEKGIIESQTVKKTFSHNFIAVFLLTLWCDNTKIKTNFIHIYYHGCNQKRFYARGTLRSIRISQWAKIPTLYRGWLRSFK